MNPFRFKHFMLLFVFLLIFICSIVYGEDSSDSIIELSNNVPGYFEPFSNQNLNRLIYKMLKTAEYESQPEVNGDGAYIKFNSCYFDLSTGTISGDVKGTYYHSLGTISETATFTGQLYVNEDYSDIKYKIIARGDIFFDLIKWKVTFDDLTDGATYFPLNHDNLIKYINKQITLDPIVVYSENGYEIQIYFDNPMLNSLDLSNGKAEFSVTIRNKILQGQNEISDGKIADIKIVMALYLDMLNNSIWINIQEFNLGNAVIDNLIKEELRKRNPFINVSGVSKPPQSDRILDVKYTNKYNLVWNDSGSGGIHDGAYYMPVAPPGYYLLGYYAQRGYGSPDGWVAVVKELEPGALKHPLDYTLVWRDRGSGADKDGAFWKPIPPPGYVAMGMVVTNGAKPSINEIVCVRDDLVVKGKVGHLIWNDDRTSADVDFGSWEIAAPANGIASGTFFGVASHKTPIDDDLVYCIKYDLPEPKEQIPEPIKDKYLDVKYTNSFELIWSDRGSGGSHDGAYYMPVVPPELEGYYALGYYGQNNYGTPIGKVALVKELVKGALAHPLDYELVWRDKGSGAHIDGAFWKPIPPPGYVALGMVVTTGFCTKPNTSAIVCVRNDLVQKAKIGSLVWNDVNTGSDVDFGSWSIEPTYNGAGSGTFFGITSHTAPMDHETLYCLKTDLSISSAVQPPIKSLEIKYINQYQLAWNDRGSGGIHDGAYYQPLPPPGFYVLGYYGQGNYNSPNGYVAVARPLVEGALAYPVDYEYVWRDKGSGAALDGAFWRPIPPPGYVALGMVVTSGAKPSIDKIMCVRNDLVVPAMVGGLVWDDTRTGADVDFGSWKIIQTYGGISTGTFFGIPSHTAPADNPILYCLKYDSVVISTPPAPGF